jgi:hypothetical protein
LCVWRVTCVRAQAGCVVRVYCGCEALPMRVRSRY